MKRSLIALAVLGGFSGMAAAQSSVTLFGIVDVSGLYVDNDGGGKRYNLATDGLNSSRIGVRGVEDLGGGMRAGFWLEAPLAADTGTANLAKFWNRRATVSLLGGFGEVRLGRDYTPIFWNNTIFDPFGTNGVGSAVNIALFNVDALVAQANFVRSDNSIGYFLPSNIGGIYGQAMVAAGEGAPGKHYSGRIGWAGGPFNVAGHYGQTDIGPGGSDTVQAKSWNVGGSWNFGFLTLMGYYGQEELDGTPLTVEDERALIGAVIPLGQGEIHVSYTQSEHTLNNVDGEAKQAAVGYVYNLSKRTALYATGSYIDNGGRSVFSLSRNNSGPALGMQVGGKSMGFEGGIRHSF